MRPAYGTIMGMGSHVSMLRVLIISVPTDNPRRPPNATYELLSWGPRYILFAEEYRFPRLLVRDAPPCPFPRPCPGVPVNAVAISLAITRDENTTATMIMLFMVSHISFLKNPPFS